jgi:hypothetical protein
MATRSRARARILGRLTVAIRRPRAAALRAQQLVELAAPGSVGEQAGSLRQAAGDGPLQLGQRAKRRARTVKTS